MIMTVCTKYCKDNCPFFFENFLIDEINEL